MIRKSDVQWWILEVDKHPESAPAIIEELAKRLIELDQENERLRNEVIALKRRVPAVASGSRVQVLQQKVETLQQLLQSQSTSETALVLLADQMRAARIPLTWAYQLANQDRPVLDTRALLELKCMLAVQPGSELLLLTNQARGFRLRPDDVSPLDESGSWPEPEEYSLEPGERLATALAVQGAPRFWTVATRRGYVQRFVRVAFDRRLAQGDQLVKSFFHNDEPVGITEGDRGDILIVTRWGKGVRFSQHTIEAQGSTALELESGDEVTAALSLPADTEVLILTASGYAVRRDTSEIVARSRPGGTGKTLIQARDVLAIYPYLPEAQLLYLTYAGKLVRISTDDIPIQDRSSRGVQVSDMRRDPAVAIALVQDQG
jgi:DNA gyrase/topoisomerase IV subunit A